MTTWTPARFDGEPLSDFRRLDALSVPAMVLGAVVIIGLPIFFSGLVFSRSLRDCELAARARDQLAGGVAGRTANKLVMIVGTGVFLCWRLSLYLASAAVLSRVGNRDAAPYEARSSQPA